MKLFALVLLMLVVIAAGSWGLGLLLDPRHVARCGIRIAAPPEAIYRELRNFEGYSTWRTELTGVEIVSGPQERLRWIEIAGNERVLLELVSERAPERLEVRIADPALPYGGTWVYELVPEGASTRVTVEEQGVVRDPIYRLLSRFVFGHTRTMESVLSALARHFGSTEKPEILIAGQVERAPSTADR